MAKIEFVPTPDFRPEFRKLMEILGIDKKSILDGIENADNEALLLLLTNLALSDEVKKICDYLRS